MLSEQILIPGFRPEDIGKHRKTRKERRFANEVEKGAEADEIRFKEEKKKRREDARTEETGRPEARERRRRLSA